MKRYCLKDGFFTGLFTVNNSLVNFSAYGIIKMAAATVFKLLAYYIILPAATGAVFQWLKKFFTVGFAFASAVFFLFGSGAGAFHGCSFIKVRKFPIRLEKMGLRGIAKIHPLCRCCFRHKVHCLSCR
jgi:hypothetical protein